MLILQIFKMAVLITLIKARMVFLIYRISPYISPNVPTLTKSHHISQILKKSP